MAAILRVGSRPPSMPPAGRSPARPLAASVWSREAARRPPRFGARAPVQPQGRPPERFHPAAGLAGYSRPGSGTPAGRRLEEPPAEDTEPFKLVYKFPGIRYCRLLSRMKLLQTGITVLTLPPVYYFYLQEQVPPHAALYATGTACFAAVILYGISYFLRRMIGLIYLNESGTTVKVAHLTFWGRKKVIYCPIETVVPLDATGDAKSEVLFQFKRYDSTQVLYFPLRYGQIMDKQRFAQIFGDSY